MDIGKSRHPKTVWICTLLLILGVLLLMGAGGPSQLVGRYQMTSIIRGNFTDIFVIDTTTGVVKWLGSDEGKPFEAIKGK